MREYFIREIIIDKLYHLSNIKIVLNPTERQHLLLTGKNGSGKTALLVKIEKYLKSINDGQPIDLPEKYYDGIQIVLNESDGIKQAYKNGDFIIAFFPAERRDRFTITNGVKDLKPQDGYRIHGDARNVLLKYMVHLKTQQAYARNEGMSGIVQKIQQWFDRFEKALQILLDEKSIHLEYDYKNYNFKIKQDNREPFSFNELSAGYSSIIYIVSDLLLRMDGNWLQGESLSKCDYQGIVLIDEIEKHLHIELQKRILPFLTEFFPNIQFIVTTYSPHILNSISNAKAYDLERQIEIDNLSEFSSENLAAGYFAVDEYSDELKKSLERYEELCLKKKLNEEECKERVDLKIRFKNMYSELSGVAKEMFEGIEQRGINDKN